MGEEMRMRDYGSSRDDDDDDYEEEEEEERVLEWEDGLPSAGDLTPLSQHLIPPELASAFSIEAEPLSTMLDVHRASQKTLSTLCRTRHKGSLTSTTKAKTKTKTNNHNNLIIKPFSSTFTEEEEDVNQSHEDPMVVEGDEEHHHHHHDDDPPGTPTKVDGSETRKIRRVLLENNTEEADSGFRTENSNDDHSARTLKRPRLVWTPQLHKRFVDVVAHLGIKNAVPKTIMQLMNVEGLTRENVASHLQKYRLYLKRMQGLSNEGPSSSDPLFASTPVPHSLHEPTGSTSTGKHISHQPPPPPMPYGGPMLPMPVLGHGFGNPAGASAAAYQGFEFHPYGMFRDQQRDWSGNNNNNRFGPMVSYPKASK